MDYTFKLDDAFVEKYKEMTPPFGFNGLGEVIYRRTYSRMVNGVHEEWYQTVRRVVEGTYSIQKNHINTNQLGWNDDQGQKSAQARPRGRRFARPCRQSAPADRR